MNVLLATTIDLPPSTVWVQVQTASLLQHIAWPLVRFIPVDRMLFSTFKPGGHYQVKLRLFGLVPFGTQWIVTSLHETDSDDWPKRLRDNGHSALVETWDHWITIEPDDQGGARYTDEVEVSAGVINPLVWAFAQIFYHHRQRRWRGLSQTLHARTLIADEMAAFRAARLISDGRGCLGGLGTSTHPFTALPGAASCQSLDYARVCYHAAQLDRGGWTNCAAGACADWRVYRAHPDR